MSQQEIQSDQPVSVIRSSWTGTQLGILAVLVIACSILVWTAYHPEDIYFHDLDYEVEIADEFLPSHDISVLGYPLKIENHLYARGISTFGNSTLILRKIPAGYRYFSAEIGIDASSPKPAGSVVFSVLANGTLLYQSPVLTKDMPPVHVFVPLLERTSLTLKVTDAGDGTEGDYANWASARFIYSL